MTSRIQQTPAELQERLDEQLRFLAHHAEQYDMGDTAFARQMATTLRVLLHDTRTSHSLLGQLGLKKRYFFDAANDPHDAERQREFDYANERRAGAFLGIIDMAFPPLLFLPRLDSQQGRDFFGFASFDEYWNRVVLMDADETHFTRRGIVLAVANQDGGAHVDPEVDEKYYRLTRQCNLGIIAARGNEIRPEISNQVALICVRQIAHEVLRTFVLDHPFSPQIAPPGIAIFTPHLVAKRDDPISTPPPASPYKRTRPGRNDSCPCRSGEKYKRCHGSHFEIY